MWERDVLSNCGACTCVCEEDHQHYTGNVPLCIDKQANQTPSIGIASGNTSIL